MEQRNVLPCTPTPPEVLYAHGYLDVDSGRFERLDKLDMTKSHVWDLTRFTLWAEGNLDALGVNFHFYPPRAEGGWQHTPAKRLHNRMMLSYKKLYYDLGTTLTAAMNHGFEEGTGRDNLEYLPLALADADDFDMEPKDPIAPWIAPTGDTPNQYIHYIKLSGLPSPDKGFAAMMENPRKNEAKGWGR